MDFRDDKTATLPLCPRQSLLPFIFFLNIQNEIEVDVEPSLIFDLFKMNRKVFQFLNSGSDMAGTPTLDRFKV